MRPYLFLILGGIALVFATCRKKDTTPTPPTPGMPGCTSLLAPANGGFVTTTSVTLSWNAVSTASSYDVYLGTTPSPTALVGNAVSGTTHTVSIPATPNATYYWYVVPRNTSGPASGCAAGARSWPGLDRPIAPWWLAPRGECRRWPVACFGSSCFAAIDPLNAPALCRPCSLAHESFAG